MSNVEKRIEEWRNYLLAYRNENENVIRKLPAKMKVLFGVISMTEENISIYETKSLKAFNVQKWAKAEASARRNAMAARRLSAVNIVSNLW